VRASKELFALAEAKKALVSKRGTSSWTVKDEDELRKIHKRALRYMGISEAMDLFITCLVLDLHFEMMEGS